MVIQNSLLRVPVVDGVLNGLLFAQDAIPLALFADFCLEYDKIQLRLPANFHIWKHRCMRYAPYDQEHQNIGLMTDRQRLEYFLTRIFEAEEVWGIDDGCEWICHRRDNQLIMPLWPYRQLAAENIADSQSDWQPVAESLEDFLYQTVKGLSEDGIVCELMPTPTSSGCLIEPLKLAEIFAGMIDAGEYRLE